MTADEMIMILKTVPGNSRVYFWVADDEGDRECHNPVHAVTVGVDSPAETSVHFDHD